MFDFQGSYKWVAPEHLCVSEGLGALKEVKGLNAVMTIKHAF